MTSPTATVTLLLRHDTCVAQPHSHCLLYIVADDYDDFEHPYYTDRGLDGPIFRPTLQNYTFGPGDRAVLKCRIDNLGTKTVSTRQGQASSGGVYFRFVVV